MRLYGVTGWKNTGKTGLMERLVAHFTAQGLRIATLKHAHHAMDVDRDGTDSFRHRAAGAQQVLVASPRRWALMTEVPAEPSLQELLAQLAPCDLVLIEGWKSEAHAKIETHRAAVAQPLLHPENPTIRAVASDVAPAVSVPLFHLDDTPAIAAFILREVGL